MRYLVIGLHHIHIINSSEIISTCEIRFNCKSQEMVRYILPGAGL